MSLRERIAGYAVPAIYALLAVAGIRSFVNDVQSVETFGQGFTVTGQAVYGLLALGAFVAWIYAPPWSFALAAGWAVAATLTAGSAPATFGGTGAGPVFAAGLAMAVIAAGVLWLHRWVRLDPGADLMEEGDPPDDVWDEPEEPVSGEQPRVLLEIPQGSPATLTVAFRGLEPAPYEVTGWLEVVGEAATVPALNLSAVRMAPGGPRYLHIRAAHAGDEEAGGSFDPETRTGELDTPVEVWAPELDEPWPIHTGGPLGVATRFRVTAEPTDDGVRLAGTLELGFLDEAPGLEAPGEFDGTFDIQDAKPCLELCLIFNVPYVTRTVVKVVNNKKVKARIRRPRFSARTLDRIVRELNRIWGCRSGQCCIRFKRVGRIGDTTLLSDPVVLPKGPGHEAAGFAGTLRRVHGGRSTSCHYVDLVERLARVAGQQLEQDSYGVTLRLDGITTSMVELRGRTGRYSLSHVADTLAHELGHTMGLGGKKPTDATGVKTHSPNRTNLMSATGSHKLRHRVRVTRQQLNRKQCDRARGFSKLKKTKDPCTFAPKERVA